MKFFQWPFCLFLLLGSAYWGLSFAQTKPLIMRHADSLSVTGKGNSLLLHGHVHFVHDSIQFKTMRATWNRGNDIVLCDGKFVFTHPNGFIRAERGEYRKRVDFASATGNVVAEDSAKTYAFVGERLQYDRKNGILTMPNRPTLYQFSVKKDSSLDTLAVKAETIIYNQKNDFAEAFQNVILTQAEMKVTADTAYFDKKNHWISMKGRPTCTLENHELSGDTIFLRLSSDGKTPESILVIRNAHGVRTEAGTRFKPGTRTEAFGDTLFAAFDGKKLKHLYVNLNANGFFFEDDLPDYKNLMEGSRLDLFFDDGKMKRATITGNAQSTYYYVKKNRSVAGKNLAAGDTIHIEFDSKKNQVQKLKVRGGSASSSGRYIDLEGAAGRQKKSDGMSDSNRLKNKTVAAKGFENIESVHQETNFAKTENSEKGKQNE